MGLHILAHQHLLLSWPRDSPPHCQTSPSLFQFAVQSSHYPTKGYNITEIQTILMPTNKLMLDRCADRVTTSIETFKRLDI